MSNVRITTGGVPVGRAHAASTDTARIVLDLVRRKYNVYVHDNDERALGMNFWCNHATGEVMHRAYHGEHTIDLESTGKRHQGDCTWTHTPAWMDDLVSYINNLTKKAEPSHA